MRPTPAITIVESATAEGIREAAEGVETPGSYQAVQLRAEQYVEKLGLLANENDTMIAPTTVGDVSSIIAERRTPYDRGRGPSRAGEPRVSAVPPPGYVLSTSSAPCGRLRAQPPRVVEPCQGSRRTASSGSGRYSVCSTQMFTYGPSRNGSLLCRAGDHHEWDSTFSR